MIRIKLILFSLILAPFTLFGQSSTSFYPEELREDAMFMRQSLERIHPSLHRYCSAEKFTATFNEVSGKLNVPLTTEQFIDTMMPVLQCISDGHTTLNLPSKDIEMLNNYIPLIPLGIQIVDDQLYVRMELKGFRSIAPGSRIISINGNDGGQIVSRLRGTLISDGENSTFKDHRIEAQFPILYRRHIDISREFIIRYESNDRQILEQTIFALTAEEIRNSGFSLNLNEPIGPLWYFSYHDEVATGWLTIRSLDPDRMEKAGIKPARFMDEVVSEMLRREAQIFVIDVRGADGKHLRLAEWLYGSFADSAYKALNNIRARDMDLLTASMIAKNASDDMIDLLARLVPAEEGGIGLSSEDLLLVKLEPHKQRFEGKVYIVQDGGTIEAAAVLGMMAVRDGRAKLVGSEAGTNAAAFCGGHQLVVKGPRTGVELRIPVVEYILDSHMPIGSKHGLKPERPARPTPLGAPQGKDTLKSALLQMITEMQW